MVTGGYLDPENMLGLLCCSVHLNDPEEKRSALELDAGCHFEHAITSSVRESLCRLAQPVHVELCHVPVMWSRVIEHARTIGRF